LPIPGIYMNRNSTYPFMNQAELIELIDGCLKEDRRTQELLYKRYSNRMWGVCLRYSRSREEAEDILQEGFMKVFDNIGKFKFEGSFEGWVRRIMVNTALRHYSRSVFKEELAGDDEEIDSLVDPQALVNISEKELLRVIDELPEGYRIVFNLYVIEGYDHKEVAAMLGIAESTSRSQLAKARLMLQKRLNKDKKQNKLFLFFLMTAGTDPFDEVVRRKLVNYSPDAPPHIWNNIVEQRSFYYRMMRLLRRNGLTFGLILLVSGLLAGISYSFISGERAYAQRNEAPQHLLAYHADDQSMEQGNPEDIFSDNAEAGSTPASFAAFSGNNGSYERESGKKRAHGKEAGAEKSGDADLQARKERITKSRKDGKGSTAKNNNALNRIIDDIAGAINGNQGKANIFQNAALASNDPLINSMLGAGRLKSSQSMKTSGNDLEGRCRVKQVTDRTVMCLFIMHLFSWKDLFR
jgi:RNA polymerase sigma factor (sigma-70 family)